MKDFYGKFFRKIEKKNFEKFFTIFFSNFFLQKFSSFRFFLQQKCFFFRKYFFDLFYYSALGRASEASGGGVGERSEPPAGGLAVGAEGSVNSEYFLNSHFFPKITLVPNSYFTQIHIFPCDFHRLAGKLKYFLFRESWE